MPKGKPDIVEPKPAEKPTNPVGESFEMLHNLEMVEYCLPYPKDKFEEDFSASSARGQHVLLAKDGEGTITFSGNGLDMSFEALYGLCETDVMNITGDAPEAMELVEDHSFSMSWMHRGKWHTLIKWYLPKFKETVSAQFDYPDAQNDYYDALIAKIRKMDPRCVEQ